MLALLSLVRSATAVAAAQQTFRTDVDLVHFRVVVTDKRGPRSTGLTATDFEVIEEGKPQTIKFFAAGDPETAPPLHHRLAARHQRQHGGGHQGRPHGGDQVPQHDGPGGRHHAGRLRHRGARRALRAAATSRA